MHIKKTKWHSYCTGDLAKGCRMCVKGKKLVLFITGLCGQRCFYCPVSEHKYGKDVVYANEWQVEDINEPKELIKEAELTEAEGAGITGGDPLVNVDRCVKYINILKKRFGKKFHIHLYTPLKLVNEERLQKLYDAGLDEIRFHPDLDDNSLWTRLELAKKYDWSIGVEIPAVPGYGEKIKKLIDYIADKVEFLNLNELERSDTTAAHYKLDEMGFKMKDNISYGVEGSEKTALELLEYAKSKGLTGHYCTAKLKDAVQMRTRIQKRAENTALQTDVITDEGTLIRGIAYLPDLSPGFGYHEKIKNANKQEIIPKLNEFKDKLAKTGINAVVDEKKLRLLMSEKIIQKKKQEIKQLGLKPAIVEEYPTADATEVDIEFI
ncbi:Radical SAM superfamily protein [uncultured archaeon]|nr:Radical SAM superfamily protein [uncultured archaeon]